MADTPVGHDMEEEKPRPCRCGRGERRKGQRNCHLCHAEANRRYRASLKKQNEALKRMAALTKKGQSA
jgi:hypothetical protein